MERKCREPTGSIDLTLAAYNMGDLDERGRERYRKAVKRRLEKLYPTVSVSVDVHVNRQRCEVFEDAVEIHGKDQGSERIRRNTVLGVAQDVWSEGGW